MKYRRNKVKREHGIIQGALEWLEELGKHPEVSDIIPGVIEVTRSPERGLVYKYETATGCKLLLKSNGSIQEAFVVTKDPDWVKKWVEGRFPVNPGNMENDRSGEGALKHPKEKRRTDKAQPAVRKDRRGRINRQSSDRDCGPGGQGWSVLSELDSPNLGEQLDSSTRKALRSLQKSLAESKLKK